MRISALVKRIVRQMLRDKRTLALLFVAPLLILTLMYFLFNTEAPEPKLAAIGVEKQLVGALEEADIQVQQYDAVTDEAMVEDDLAGALQQEGNMFTLTLQNSDPTAAKALQLKVNQAIAAQAQVRLLQQNPAAANMGKASVETSYVYGNSETNFFDILSPILVGFFVFFFVFLISGIGLLRERTTGTLERLMSTPIRKGEIVAAYLIGYGMFAVMQTIIVVLYAVQVLDIVLVGSIWNVLLINLLLALVALSLGILLSSFAASEFQMVQFIPIVVIPQIFFAGIFPVEGMASWLQGVGKVMPLYYAADALKSVMYKGLGFGEIRNDLLVLVMFAIIFIILNIIALRKYRAM